MDEAQRKDLRKTAKRLIKVAKKHPKWYSKEDVRYAKLIKKQNKNMESGGDGKVRIAIVNPEKCKPKKC